MQTSIKPKHWRTRREILNEQMLFYIKTLSINSQMKMPRAHTTRRSFRYATFTISRRPGTARRLPPLRLCWPSSPRILADKIQNNLSSLASPKGNKSLFRKEHQLTNPNSEEQPSMITSPNMEKMITELCSLNQGLNPTIE